MINYNFLSPVDDLILSHLNLNSSLILGNRISIYSDESSPVDLDEHQSLAADSSTSLCPFKSFLFPTTKVVGFSAPFSFISFLHLVKSLNDLASVKSKTNITP